MQDEEEIQYMHEDCTESSTSEEENEGFCLCSIDASRHLSVCVDVAELIKHSEDLKDKLLNVQKESHRIGTKHTITRSTRNNSNP